MTDADLRRLSIDTIRALSMDAVQKANAGHPGTAMALAPLAYLLYAKHLRHNPADPAWPDRDRFILSAGHAGMLQYAVLHLTGYDLSLEDLQQFRQWGSKTPGHPERGHTAGIEVTTGPLGQGISNAVGFAMAERFLGQRYNRPTRPVVDHRVYVIASDGDLMEGISAEAASLAGQFGLGKIIAFYDDNRITIDGSTEISFSVEDRAARYAAQGWHVQTVAAVEDLDALDDAIEAAKAVADRPSLVVVRTHIAHPAPHATDTWKAHGAPLGKDEVAATKRIMGFDPEQSFEVPAGVYAHMSQRERGAVLQAGWQERFAAWSTAFPTERADWDQVATGKPRPGLAEALPVFPAGEGVATRDAGKKIMQAFKGYVPTMIGGSADLVESNKTVFEGGGLFSSTHAGRNIPFGIREHAMGAIVNGLAAHGGIVKPYGATFLVFSDYMRGAVRLSALMGLPVVWVWTHDSLGVGEDGPTHQPIEHLAVLRAIPNLWVMRPGDANEAAIGWKVALEREDGPVALILSRQKLPTLDRTEVAPVAGVERGGYVLWDSAGTPEIVLIGTGSELSLALEAGRALAAQGRAVRVVSLPCIELFVAQPQAYRDEVLPPAVRARIAVEAGVRMGWHRWVGDAGAIVGVDRFGHSAPGDRVFAEYGFSVENVTARALALLERA